MQAGVRVSGALRVLALPLSVLTSARAPGPDPPVRQRRTFYGTGTGVRVTLYTVLYIFLVAPHLLSWYFPWLSSIACVGGGVRRGADDESAVKRKWSLVGKSHE